MSTQTKDRYLDEGLQGWLVNTAKKHYWKVASWCDMDDLIQEGYLCFAKCRAKFKFTMDEPTPDNRKEFMAFFQMAFINRITDLQKNPRSRLKEVGFASLPEEQAEVVETWADTPDLGDATLMTLLSHAPAEIGDMLKQILIEGLAETPYLKTRLRKKFLPGCAVPRIIKGRRKLRETTEEHYDRCLNKAGVVEKLRNYFLGEGDDALIDKLVRSLFSQEPPEVCVNDPIE